MAVNSVTPAQQADITALYAAFWNRAPDTTGFGFWVQAYANGASLSSIATQFRADPEGIAAYPLASTNVQLITEVYQNVFDRAPDPTGLAFWTNALNTMTFPNVVISMVQAALKPGNTDGALFANKVQVGEYVAITVETDNYNVTSHAFDLVTASPASVQEAEAWVDMQVTGSTYTLTTKADIATAQYFDGALNDHGQQTLNNFDQLTGQRDVNKLDAQVISGYAIGSTGYLSVGYNDVVTSYVTPELLKNIQVVDVQVTPSGHAGNLGGGGGGYYYCIGGSSYTYDTGATVDLRNADDVQVVVNDGSSASLTFNNVGSTLTDVAVKNTQSDTTVNFAPGADIALVNLNLSNVNYGYFGLPNIDISAPETVNISSTVLPNNVSLSLASATTLNIAGDADLSVYNLSNSGTQSVSSINAATFTGDLDIALGDQAQVLSTTVISVTGGLGNDTIDTTDVSQNYIVTGGAGNDTFIDYTLTATDTIIGGLGHDKLTTTFDIASTINSVNGVDGIDELSVTPLNGSLTVANVDSTIVELEVDSVFNAALTLADSTVVGSAGAFELELGSARSMFDAVDNALAHALTVTDTGTATTDTLTITNQALNIANNTNQDVFNGQNVTSNGYENIVINTGTASPALQEIGTLAIVGDSTSAAVSLTANGSSPISITSLTSNSTGQLTVNASGLNVLTSAAGLTIGGTTLTTIGTAKATQSITGSAGADSITVGNWAATVIGGTGSDSIVGGTQADWLQGDAGNDTLTGSGGNDTILGGDGNDTISSIVAGNVSIDGGAGNDTVAMGATLNSSDVVSGGIAGVDTLSVLGQAVSAADVLGVTNFEVLATDTSQVMTNFLNNSGWTTVDVLASGVTISNALAAVNTLQIDNAASGGATTFLRLVDTGTDTLTVATAGATGAITVTSLGVDNEETLTINTSNGAAGTSALTVNSMVAADVASLTLTGDNAVTISAITGGTHLATVNASALTAAVTIDAHTSTTALTFTGSSASVNTFTSGSGSDSLTGGSANDTIAGNAGNDTVTLGNGADTFIFGNQGTAVTGAATIAQAYASVGSDTVVNFVSGSDKLEVTEAAFGDALITTGNLLDATQFAAVTSTTALLTGLTDEGFVSVQSAANAAASIYYVDQSVTTGTQSIDSLILGGHAVLVGTLQSVTGTIAATDFYTA